MAWHVETHSSTFQPVSLTARYPSRLLVSPSDTQPWFVHEAATGVTDGLTETAAVVEVVVVVAAGGAAVVVTGVGATAALV